MTNCIRFEAKTITLLVLMSAAPIIVRAACTGNPWDFDSPAAMANLPNNAGVSCEGPAPTALLTWSVTITAANMKSSAVAGTSTCDDPEYEWGAGTVAIPTGEAAWANGQADVVLKESGDEVATTIIEFVDP